MWEKMGVWYVSISAVLVEILLCKWRGLLQTQDLSSVPVCNDTVCICDTLHSFASASDTLWQFTLEISTWMSHSALSHHLHVQSKVCSVFMSIALWICSINVHHAHWQSSLCLYLKPMLSISELTAGKKEDLVFAYLYWVTDFLLPVGPYLFSSPSHRPGVWYPFQ